MLLRDLTESSAFLVATEDTPGLWCAVTGSYFTVYADVRADELVYVEVYENNASGDGLYSLNAADLYDRACEILRAQFRALWGGDSDSEEE